MQAKQLKRYEIISRAVDGLLTVKEAAQGLGISERQVMRLKKTVKEEGANGVKHGNANKSSPRRLSEAMYLDYYSNCFITETSSPKHPPAWNST
ncbi:hypothetical protein AGMMS49992_27720 [Clostridia bacterium]|nr:hypothetical protein AGMMS49992_27720 [Clostridia bacterium]